MIKNPNGRGRTGKPRGGHLLPDGLREHRYSRELAEEICRRIAAGETLAEICADPKFRSVAVVSGNGISTTAMVGSRPNTHGRDVCRLNHGRTSY